MDNRNVLIGLAVVVVLAVAYYWFYRKQGEKEPFTYDQIALNAKNYTFIPKRNCNDCLPQARPDFSSMACNNSTLPKALQGMTQEQIQQEIDLHYRKPMEMVDPSELLPDQDISGLSFGTDPAEDFANKYVWHRTTHARLKRRNWEGGSSMIRGDLIITPVQHSWFNHDKDYRDLTVGFVPQQYCGEINVQDLTYNMTQTH